VTTYEEAVGYTEPRTMSPERALAGILTAFHAGDGLHIDYELLEALKSAEKDFDGIEEVEMLYNGFGETLREVVNGNIRERSAHGNGPGERL